ncbi:MAG: tRNA (N6-threonylcarbamoyladenosine(37)-N6)-methyltransferase TrmO [Halobacteria archaeon]|nr:tRNA (N6-threonylcarbamoyladenosine(37)-N6)-methyltransferase TrmO [Halobacteria archaeon]
MKFDFQPIGIIHSCFPEKFGIPRQPGLVKEATATLELLPPYDRTEALEGLEAFSHLWLIFVFHASLKETWKPTVRPPRLGGNKRVGVFASRSMFRPNPIGLSVVELERVDTTAEQPRILLKGVDLLDGTPVLDIKPYLPYVDAIPNAHGGYAQGSPEPRLKVRFSSHAAGQCASYENAYPNLRTLITHVLELDPRPAYYDTEHSAKEFGMRLLDFDIKWRIDGQQVEVMAIEKVV